MRDQSHREAENSYVTGNGISITGSDFQKAVLAPLLKSEGFIVWGHSRSPVARRPSQAQPAPRGNSFPLIRRKLCRECAWTLKKNNCAHLPNDGLCAWLKSAQLVLISTSVPQALPSIKPLHTVSKLCNSETKLKVTKDFWRNIRSRRYVCIIRLYMYVWHTWNSTTYVYPFMYV